MVSFFGLIVTEQYVTPAIVNSYGAFDELRYLQAIERLLKLSVPTLWGWLVVFYSLFHLLLNIVAELTRFGDREFYRVSAVLHAADLLLIRRLSFGQVLQQCVSIVFGVFGRYWCLFKFLVQSSLHRPNHCIACTWPCSGKFPKLLSSSEASFSAY